MFSLIFGFYNLLFSKPDIHVLVIGLDHAGKSTLLEHIKTVYSRVQGLPSDKITPTPTIGMNLGKFKHKGTQVIMWDLGGQLKMRAIWERYYDEAQAVVFVVDAADPARLQEAKVAYDTACASPALQDVPIMIFANKQDLPGALPLHEIAEIFYAPDEAALSGIQNLGIKKLAVQNEVAARASHRLFGISALTGRGVSEAMEALMTVRRACVCVCAYVRTNLFLCGRRVLYCMHGESANPSSRLLALPAAGDEVVRAEGPGGAGAVRVGKIWKKRRN